MLVGIERELLLEVVVVGIDISWEKIHFFQGTTSGLVVGVIDESKFRFSDECHCYLNAHCFHNTGNQVWGCLSGNKTQWNPGELLEINVNLVNSTLTIKSVSNSSINLTGTLPRLSRGNCYPYALLSRSDHGLEIVGTYYDDVMKFLLELSAA
ncbi:hypothetical protein GEMRC1_000230 [Eukaryota sp. GEM-RC1]